MTVKTIDTRYSNLCDLLRSYGRVAVAFSGGVDSSWLAFAALLTLGRENVICITADAPAFPRRELNEAVSFCKTYGIIHETVYFDQLSLEEFSSNMPDRCYFCKRELLKLIFKTASANGFEIVIDGTNADDEGDYRPGMKAVRELGVKSPLLEAGFTKNDIRLQMKEYALEGWSRPSYACLASRFVYGEKITLAKLEMVAAAEQFLIDRGIDSNRVRIHGENNYIARIETIPEYIEKLSATPLRTELWAYFKALGFTYAALDLAGYVTGSMNKAIENSR